MLSNFINELSDRDILRNEESKSGDGRKVVNSDSVLEFTLGANCSHCQGTIMFFMVIGTYFFLSISGTSLLGAFSTIACEKTKKLSEPACVRVVLALIESPTWVG